MGEPAHQAPALRSSVGYATSPRLGKGRLILRALISFGLSAAFIAFSLRNTNARAVIAAIAGADWRPIFAYLAILLLVHFVRTIRWKLLLEPIGKVTFAQVNSACAIGFMLLMTLPLRLGELARPVLISRPSPTNQRLPRSGAMATVVIERIVDSLGLGLLGILSLRMLAASGSAAEFARHASAVVFSGFALLCGVLVVSYFMRERAISVLQKVLSPLSPSLSNRAAGVLDRFIRGLHLGSAWRLIAVLGLTGLHWALHVLGFWLVADAFGLRISLLMAGTTLVVQAVGIMIPAGPGMIGTSQFFTQLGLSIFIPGALTVPAIAARAAAYANTIWLLQFGQQAILGLVFVLVGHISISAIVKGSD
jgi:uncharacterized protein (TIRG00374 family)